jgi:hypothetical protein
MSKTILLAIIATVLCGCEPAGTKNRSSSLPEATGWKIRGADLEKALVCAARGYLEKEALRLMRHTGQDGAVQIGNLVTARDQFSRYPENNRPIAIFGYYGLLGQQAKLVLDHYNANRETVEVRVLIRGEGERFWVIARPISRCSKALELCEAVVVPVRLVSGDTLVEIYGTGGFRTVELDQQQPVALPHDDYSVSACVVDRSSGVSNFVPLGRFDTWEQRD